MTVVSYRQFLRLVRKHRWRLNLDGGIKSIQGLRSACTWATVGNAVTPEKDASNFWVFRTLHQARAWAARAWGLGNINSSIWWANDNRPGYDPTVRRDLLKACRLREPRP